MKLNRRGEGAGELDVYFDPDIPLEERIIFSKFVHENVMKKGQDVVRLRHYVCSHCGAEVGNRNVAMKRLNDWLEDGRGGDTPTMICVACEKRFLLWDDMEHYFASPEAQQKVRDVQKQTEIVIDNESKERTLVGEVISTVALAGQICREINVSDHGIDAEVEFKDDEGKATGEKVYLQLKSGDSYLRERKSDSAQLFTIPKKRHREYWMNQAFPVMLVTRNSEGEVQWMEVRDYLKRVTEDGKKQIRQIEFKGERFDVMAVRGWRHEALGGTT